MRQSRDRRPGLRPIAAPSPVASLASPSTRRPAPAWPFRGKRRDTVQRGALFIASLAVCFAACLAGSEPTPAHAQDASEAPAPDMSPPLAKAEVEQLIAAGRISYLRKRDNAKVNWDFKGSDTVYFTTSATQRNIQVAGTYKVTNDGAVCFQWNRDKYMTMQDGCVRFRRSANALHVVGHNDPDRVAGNVLSE